jgi:hypothetical protein
MLKMADLPDI